MKNLYMRLGAALMAVVVAYCVWQAFGPYLASFKTTASVLAE